MSVDFTTALFATEVFGYISGKHKFDDIISRYSKPYTTDEFPTNLTLHVAHAVMCRIALFKNKISDDISKYHNEFSFSSMDFYLCYFNNIDMWMPSKSMNIFEKVFMSLAVIIQMADFCWTKQEKVHHFYDAPFYWAMYFDSEMKDLFFTAGGWNVLHEHAARYVDSNVLYDEHIMACCTNRDDLLHVTRLFGCVYSTFDVKALISHYENICVRRRGRACLSCQPLFTVLQSMFAKTSSKYDSNELIEGYFQLFLKLPNNSELLSFFEMTKKLQSSKETNVCQKDLHPENPLTNTKHEDEYKERRRIYTDCLINRVFLEKQYFERSESSNTEILDNFCVFCLKILPEISFESLPSEPWNHIKSRIYETIEAEKSEEVEQNKKVESNELKSKTSSEIHKQKKLNSSIKEDINFLKQNRTLDGTNQEKLNTRIDNEEDSNSVKKFIVDESGLLKMFYILGCKEETIDMLTSLNRDSKNYEDLSETVDNLSLEKEQTEKNLKNLSKKKKRKHNVSTISNVI